MRARTWAKIGAMLFVLGATEALPAAVPQLVGYQGMLLDATDEQDTCAWQWHYVGDTSYCGVGSAGDRNNDCWEASYSLPSASQGGRTKLGVGFEAIGLNALTGVEFTLYAVSGTPDILVEVYDDMGDTRACGSVPSPTLAGLRYSVVVPNTSLIFGAAAPNYVPMPNITWGTLDGGSPQMLWVSISENSGLGSTSLTAYGPAIAGPACPPNPMYSVAYFPSAAFNGGLATWEHLGQVPGGTGYTGREFSINICTEPVPVSFYGTPREGDPPLAVFFTGETDTTVDHWTWRFGDGDSALIQNPMHVYSNPGSYTVSLEAVVGAETFTVTRQAYIRVNSLRAEFSGTPRAGVNSLDVHFTGLSTGGPTEWAWDFGDGGSASVPNPSHTYVDTGWFAVTLRVSNATDSDSVRLLNYIRVDTVAQPDLDVNVYGNVRPRPGFVKRYHVRVRNLGISSTSGDTLRFMMPPQTTYVHSAPLGSASGDTVKWTVGLLSPGDSALDYQVYVHIPVSVPVGTALLARASADSVVGEIMCANNHRGDSEQVVASVDPNEKVVQPTGCGPGNDLIQEGERLTYTIFFENKPEATAEAIYVLVVDTLDPDFDWGTLQVGPTIKDAVLSFNFDPFSGELRWFFDGINLPPNVNPPEGEGFVAYTISPRSGLPPGTVISNRAHIRFDYNPWLSAPDAGPLNLTISPCPCDCPCHGDPFCDSTRCTLQDVVKTVDVAFRGADPVTDPNCPQERTDVNCDDYTTVQDVVKVVNVAFRSADPATEFCDPCAP